MSIAHRYLLRLTAFLTALFVLVLSAQASGPDLISAQEAAAVGSFDGQASAPTISAQEAILVEESGLVLYAHNADTRMPMASTTKIMTALTLLSDGVDLSDLVTVDAAAVGVEGSSIYLYEGERLTYGQLMDALLMESANDAATALAVANAGSVDAFAEKMNACADALGLRDTHFVNPHGLAHEAHYTTARELSVIARAAMQYEAFRASVSCYKKEIPLRGSEGVRLLINHNKLLKTLDGCIGIKTGYTKSSGRCLVSACERGGVTLYCVTLAAPDDWQDHVALYEWGFAQAERVTLTEVGEQFCSIPVVGGIDADGNAPDADEVLHVSVKNTDAVTAVLPRDHAEIRKEVRLPRFLYAPVRAGDAVGCVVYTDGGDLSVQVPLYACETILAYEKPSLWQRLKTILKIFD